MLRIYPCSLTADQEYLVALAAKEPSFHFHARWLKHIAIGTTESPKNSNLFWQENHQDIAAADLVMVFGLDKDKPLRGALVEAGMALAMNKPVVVVGDHLSFGSWQYHPLVARAKSIQEAIQIVEEVAQRFVPKNAGN